MNMKQQQDKVIRKGDYYEMEVADEVLYSIKAYKKDDAQPSMQINSDSIVTALPTFTDAQAKYYYQEHNHYSSAEPDQLLHQLEDILNSQKLADEDKQEVLKLIREIKVLKEEPMVPLIELQPSKKIREKEAVPMGKVQLKIAVDLSDIESRIGQLQQFPYPELNQFEHQLQILLGQKKATPHSQIPKEDRNKEEVDQLFTLLNSLNNVHNISGVVDKVHANSSKYSEMASWAQKIEATTSLHLDFLAELKEDELLLNQLEANFKDNVETVRKTIEKIKTEAKK